MKPLFWLGSSKKDLLALPIAIRKFFSHALDSAQHGIETPKPDMDIIRQRMKAAAIVAQELKSE